MQSIWQLGRQMYGLNCFDPIITKYKHFTLCIGEVINKTEIIECCRASMFNFMLIFAIFKFILNHYSSVYVTTTKTIN